MKENNNRRGGGMSETTHARGQGSDQSSNSGNSPNRPGHRGNHGGSYHGNRRESLDPRGSYDI